MTLTAVRARSPLCFAHHVMIHGFSSMLCACRACCEGTQNEMTEKKTNRKQRSFHKKTIVLSLGPFADGRAGGSTAQRDSCFFLVWKSFDGFFGLEKF